MADVVAFFWKMLEIVLEAALPILAVAAATWIAQKIRELGKSIDANTMASIEWAVKLAVTAAEQAGVSGLVADKKVYAIKFAQDYLDKQKIGVNVSVLEGLIEAAVKDAEFPPVPRAPVVPAA
jgi:hypothetical protein